jgi:hypothetical protein
MSVPAGYQLIGRRHIATADLWIATTSAARPHHLQGENAIILQQPASHLNLTQFPISAIVPKAALGG